MDYLERFVSAQAPVYPLALGELARGRKTSHWMWFIFPQLRGLGHSPMAVKYSLASADEALAYWQHEVLGPRLRECTSLVLGVENKSALEIMGSPDDMKLWSCMTLFESIAVKEPLFTRVLSKFYGGERDARSLSILGYGVVGRRREV